MSIIIAFSTIDGKNLANSHFGDADMYPVYEISKNEIKFIETLKNSSLDKNEKIHGNPKKARGITQILKPHKVQILCGKQFGKNIVRMVKEFVPVLVKVDTVEEALPKIQQNMENIEIQWEKGENRKHIRIN